MTNVMKKMTLATSLATSASALGLQRTVAVPTTTNAVPTTYNPSNPSQQGVMHEGKFYPSMYHNGRYFPTFHNGWEFIGNQSWKYIGRGPQNIAIGTIYSPTGYHTPIPTGNATNGPVAGYNGNGDAIPNVTTGTTGTTTTVVTTGTTTVGPLTKEELTKRAMNKLTVGELKALLDAKIAAKEKEDDKPTEDAEKMKNITAEDFEKMLTKKSDPKTAAEFWKELALTPEQKEKVFAKWTKKELEAVKDKVELVTTLYTKSQQVKAPFTKEQKELAQKFVASKNPTPENGNSTTDDKPSDDKPMSKGQIKRWLEEQTNKLSDVRSKYVMQRKVREFMAKDLNTNVTEAKLAAAWKSVQSSDQSTEKLEELLVKKTNTPSHRGTDDEEDRYNHDNSRPQSGSKATKQDLIDVLNKLMKKGLPYEEAQEAVGNFKENKFTKEQVKSLRSVKDLVALKLVKKEDAKPDVNDFDGDETWDSPGSRDNYDEDEENDVDNSPYRRPDTNSDSDKKTRALISIQRALK